jgi:antitoxin ParD1/3/4/toxin ParE1/3/4
VSATFLLSAEAIEDLDEIWLYIARDSIDAADRVELALREAMRLLGERPGIGHVREDLTERAVKFWPVFAYLIVYDPGKRPVEIVRILHGALDIPSLL